uniref:Solute carrier family 39 member 1 n=1 Tax=Pavo cristatus TaxID=9049 RepID=A0A8C9LDE4_PAVCR
MGFLLVLVLEHAALALHDRPAGAEEEEDEEATAALLTAGDPPTPPGRPSPLRAGLLVLALVLHGALEGLALGLQEPGGAALRLCLALLLHKGLVAFSLALQLLRGRLRRLAVAASLLLFSAASPLGAAVGAAVEAAGGGPRQRLGRSVAEGLAAGAFLYVTLLEVLPRELGGARLRVPKVLALLGGFALVTATLFIRV